VSAISVDVEADGPCPGLYNMVSFGAVLVDGDLSTTFYSGIIKPTFDDYIPEALAVSGVTRAEQMEGVEPLEAMTKFAEWTKENCKTRPIFYSDNNGFDWQFINWYFHKFYGSNPYGFSSQNIGSLYKGIVRNRRKNFKHLRKTKHTHHPVDDAKGNAEAILHMINNMRLK
jgi:hypothetical protein